MIFIAHRGFRVGVAENTFHAFDKAYGERMDYIELDVQCSKDGELFVLHDEKLDRTMLTNGRLRDKKKIELETVKSKEFNSFLPTLKETLDHYLLLEPHTIKFMIELKGENTGKKAAVQINNLNVHDRIVFSGRHLAELKAAHREAPAVPLCLNITSSKKYPLQKFMKARAKEELPLPFAMISLRSTEIQLDFIQQCHRFGIQALTWDFIKLSNPANLMQQLIEMRIDGILFDDPGTVEQIRATTRK